MYTLEYHLAVAVSRNLNRVIFFFFLFNDSGHKARYIAYQRCHLLFVRSGKRLVPCFVFFRSWTNPTAIFFFLSVLLHSVSASSYLVDFVKKNKKNILLAHDGATQLHLPQVNVTPMTCI